MSPTPDEPHAAGDGSGEADTRSRDERFAEALGNLIAGDDDSVQLEPVDQPQALEDLERLLGGQRMTLIRVRRGDWEARCSSGCVGRGESALEALAELADRLR